MTQHVLQVPHTGGVETVIHHSEKRYHVLASNNYGRLVRHTSSDSRTRALSAWRHLASWTSAWLLDGDTGEVIRTPDSPRLTGSTR